MAVAFEQMPQEISRHVAAAPKENIPQLATDIYKALGLASADSLRAAAAKDDFNVEDCVRHAFRSRPDLMPKVESLARAVHSHESGALSPEQKLVCETAVYFFPPSEKGVRPVRVGRTNALRPKTLHS